MKALFYNSTLPSSITSAVLFLMKYPGEIIQDIAGLDETAIDNIIADFTSDSLDEVFVCVPVDETSSVGQFTHNQIAKLLPYMTTSGKGAVIATGTAQGVTSLTDNTIILAADDPASTGEYVDKIIYLSDGTGEGQIARIKANDGTTKEVIKYAPDWATNPDVDTVYEIYSPAIREYYNLTVSNYDGVYQMWNNLFSGIVPPQVIRYIMRDVTPGNPAGTRWACAKGTATSGSSDSLTDSGASFGTSDELVGKYVYISSGTGIGQYRKILSHTDTELTISTGTTDWVVNPDVDSVYWVVEREIDVFRPEYFLMWVKTYGKDFSKGDIWKMWSEMLDANGNLRAGKIKVGMPPYQIQDTIENMLLVGKHIYDYTIL